MKIIKRQEAKEQGLTQYFTGKPCKNGHVAARWVSSMVCTICTSSRTKQWREENQEHRTKYRRVYREKNIERERQHRRDYYDRNKDRLNEERKKDYNNDPIKYMLYRAKDRATKNNIPFDLEYSDLSLPETCPVFNKPFVIGDYNWAPSLDRIIPEKGYIKGNVMVISTKANRIKNDATYKELLQVALFLENISAYDEYSYAVM